MTTMQIDRAVVEQALEALRELLPDERDPNCDGYDARDVRQWRATATALRAALAQQVEPLNLRDPAVQKRLATQWGYVPAAQAEPVARECSDPMCACRGGPCAECEEGEREKEIEDLRSSLYFYQRRCEALQSWQSKMRDPERTIVCDILANGKTLDSAVAGDRYTTPSQQAEPDHETRAELAEQQVVQLAEERDHYRNLWQKAQQAEPVAADALTEPKSGDKWRVEWWNESCRMMLPAHAKLDSFVAYKNGTIQFTIKRTAA